MLELRTDTGMMIAIDEATIIAVEQRKEILYIEDNLVVLKFDANDLTLNSKEWHPCFIYAGNFKISIQNDFEAVFEQWHEYVLGGIPEETKEATN